MLFGFLIPLLHRFGVRKRTLIAVAVMAVGLALVLAFALQGHAPGRYVLLARFGLLLSVGGLGLLGSSVRGHRRHRLSHSGNAEQPDDQP
jgi:peptidoglycan/LPS O-acetylase OafA/YrhL